MQAASRPNLRTGTAESTSLFVATYPNTTWAIFDDFFHSCQCNPTRLRDHRTTKADNWLDEIRSNAMPDAVKVVNGGR